MLEMSAKYMTVFLLYMCEGIIRILFIVLLIELNVLNMATEYNKWCCQLK